MAKDPFTRKHKNYLKQGKSFHSVSIDPRSKKDNREVNEAVTRAIREGAEKENKIYNAIGPHSNPGERHYPKSFFINQQAEEKDNEQEKEPIDQTPKAST